MADALDTIRRFVDGSLSPMEFRDLLYSDNAIEVLLSNDPHLPPAHYVRQDGGIFYFLLAQDYDDPGGVLNAHGALGEYLDRNGITYTQSTKYSDFYHLVLEAAPNWLDPNHKFVRDHILPDAEGLSGEPLRAWLSQKLLERFKCAGDPPEWIQSPCWPVNENGPLVFLGQLDVPNYFHDLAAAYVFYDPASGECKTIVQVH